MNLLSPFYIGVDVTGTLDDLKIRPAKCIYAQDFRPLFHNKVDSQTAELRQLIRDSMRRNVKQETLDAKKPGATPEDEDLEDEPIDELQ